MSMEIGLEKIFYFGNFLYGNCYNYSYFEDKSLFS